MIVNDYIYKDELHFDSTVEAYKYFEGLGFSKQTISYNIRMDKNSYDYIWSYDEIIYDDEEWRNVSEIICNQYDLSVCSNYGRFRNINKKHTKIRNPGNTFAVDNITIHLGDRKKSYGINVLVCSAFNGPSKPGQKVVHKDGNVKNYQSTNLEWW